MEILKFYRPLIRNSQSFTGVFKLEAVEAEASMGEVTPWWGLLEVEVLRGLHCLMFQMKSVKNKWNFIKFAFVIFPNIFISENNFSIWHFIEDFQWKCPTVSFEKMFLFFQMSLEIHVSSLAIDFYEISCFVSHHRFLWNFMFHLNLRISMDFHVSSQPIDFNEISCFTSIYRFLILASFSRKNKFQNSKFWKNLKMLISFEPY